MNYFFGQQHIGTVNLFDNLSNTGWYHTVNMKDSPHYKFLCGNTDLYVEYLKNSWRYYNISENKIPEKIQKFKNLINDITSSRHMHTPVKLVETFDGRKIVYSGNHRVAIHLHSGAELKIENIDLKDYIADIVRIDDVFYGTKRLGMPYQTINFRGDTILTGRRNDIEDRISLIDNSDLVGKSVIDFGCNLGMSLLPIFDRGATEAIGIEINKKIISSAIKLNVLFGLPIRYICHDLAEPLLLDRKYHTGFVFSVDQHVKNNRILADNIKRSVSNTVYFETHQRKKMPVEMEELFNQIDQISTTKDGRVLYRCKLKDTE
jgi:2-polyprenyl-3-methyl-5-hydroxy-6-metoxy-1,4-benzoquinol methylase